MSTAKNLINFEAPSILDQFNVSTSLSTPEYAFEIYKKFLLAKRGQEYLFMAMGKLLKEIRDKKLYLTLDYDNFGQFLSSDEISISRESAFQYIRVYEFYIQYLELDENYVGKMPVSKLSIMLPMLKKVETKEEAIKLIEDMAPLGYADFIREVKLKTDRSGKPQVYFSNELDKWIVQYYDNKTVLYTLGDYENTVPTKEFGPKAG